MADKEQRIWLEFDIQKPQGAIEATRCTTMTRAEAIERMAKAFNSVVTIISPEACLEGTEAALNALLGEEGS